MRINAAKREVSFKIVYYGPGLSGKTTNLKQLYTSSPRRGKGELIVLDTETDRTLFFDYFPQTLGYSNGMKVKLEFFTVPGQSFYRRTRELVLKGADGVVFVADSDPRRELANERSYLDLRESLSKALIDYASFPIVFQWNKQDLPNAQRPEVLSRLLNAEGKPSHSACASDGIGVIETLDTVASAVLDSFTKRARRASESQPTSRVQ
ncbi:MAG: ADP-ribosylation factor-like protein [Myxococcota bacterium]|nr:ADP-ribosylation factor-like protein [Myxococcota bacterium]